MSLDDTFSENAPTVGPQIRTLRLVEHVRPEQEQAYLEWSREFSDAHANFIAARDPESWSSVVMIRDRAFGRNDVRYIKVFRFPDDAIFEAWTASDERREMIRKGLALNFAVDENALERVARGVEINCNAVGSMAWDSPVYFRTGVPAAERRGAVPHLRHVHGGPE